MTIFKPGDKLRCIQLLSRLSWEFHVPHEGPWIVKDVWNTSHGVDTHTRTITLDGLTNDGMIASRFILWVDEPSEADADWNPAAGMWMTASDVRQRLTPLTWIQVPTSQIQEGDTYANHGTITNIWHGPCPAPNWNHTGPPGWLPAGRIRFDCGPGFSRTADHTSLVVIGRPPV